MGNRMEKQIRDDLKKHLNESPELKALLIKHGMEIKEIIVFQCEEAWYSGDVVLKHSHTGLLVEYGDIGMTAKILSNAIISKIKERLPLFMARIHETYTEHRKKKQS